MTDNQRIASFVQAHWELQLGSYFSELVDVNGAIYNFGGLIKDYYWNYAGMINIPKDESDSLIERVILTATSNGVSPAFYIDPTTQPSSFSDDLARLGFKPDDEEIWMHCNSPSQLSCKTLTEADVRRVDSSDDMDRFISIFNDGFEMLEEGQTTSPYSESLVHAFTSPPSDVAISHYIAKIENQDAAIASIYQKGTNAGLYNVTVLDSFRRHGLGCAISLHACRKAFESTADTIILQTELDGEAHSLYSSLGFEDSFVGVIWANEENE